MGYSPHIVWNQTIRLADGQLDAALDDSRGDGVTGEAGDLVDVELGHEILPVFFDRLDADAEFRRRLFVGLAFGNQLEHLQLTRTQASHFFPQRYAARRDLLVVQSPGNGGAEKGVPL